VLPAGGPSPVAAPALRGVSAALSSLFSGVDTVRTEPSLALASPFAREGGCGSAWPFGSPGDAPPSAAEAGDALPLPPGRPSAAAQERWGVRGAAAAWGRTPFAVAALRVGC
jgi:hypothetical protein